MIEMTIKEDYYNKSKLHALNIQPVNQDFDNLLAKI